MNASCERGPDVHEDAVDAFVDALLDDDAEQLYDRAPCGYISTTPDGSIIKANATFLTLTGYTRGQLIGRRRFVDLLSGGGRIYHETHYAPMLRMAGSAREVALELVREDGTRLPVLVNAVLERDAEGSAVVIRAAIFDASERRQYERELLREKQRAEENEARATALARTLQKTLIPPLPPQVPGLDVGSAFRPAGTSDQIGGDFYDVFQLADQDWVAVVGDVCGKGMDAAVITALLRHALRAAAVAAPEPAACLAIVNDVLRQHDTERFCTALLVRMHRRDESWRATLCAAGHPLPLLVPACGAVRPVGRPGSLLGVLPELDLAPTEVDLGPGDRLLLYTDGVHEARRDGQEYGEARLCRLAQDTSGAQPLVDAVLQDVLRYQRGVPRDDIALLALGPA